jgi:hypothetical protein
VAGLDFGGGGAGELADLERGEAGGCHRLGWLEQRGMGMGWGGVGV